MRRTRDEVSGRPSAAATTAAAPGERLLPALQRSAIEVAPFQFRPNSTNSTICSRVMPCSLQPRSEGLIGHLHSGGGITESNAVYLSGKNSRVSIGTIECITLDQSVVTATDTSSATGCFIQICGNRGGLDAPRREQNIEPEMDDIVVTKPVGGSILAIVTPKNVP